MKLLRTLILRPLRRDLLRTALTILSVALGVAVVVAIDLAGDAATGSFRSSMQTLAGKTDLKIIATGGVDERYMAALSVLPFDVHFAPLMEAQILLPGIGAALGVLLGRILAGGAVRLIADTVNALYTTSRPAAIALTAFEAWTGILTGALVAFASALAPAREAMLVAPTEAMSRGALGHPPRLRCRRGLGWSALSGALALAASQAVPVSGYPVGGYVAALLAIGAAALAAPAVVIAVNRATRRVVHSHVVGLLAGRSLTASLSRTSVVVAALATAIAMMASVGIMVGSF